MANKAKVTEEEQRIADSMPVVPAPEPDAEADAEQAARNQAEADNAAKQAQADAEAKAAEAAEEARIEAERVAALAVAEASNFGDVTVTDLITPKKSDNPEQSRLREVYKNYFIQQPERGGEVWAQHRMDLMNALKNAVPAS